MTRNGKTSTRERELEDALLECRKLLTIYFSTNNAMVDDNCGALVDAFGCTDKEYKALHQAAGEDVLNTPELVRCVRGHYQRVIAEKEQEFSQFKNYIAIGVCLLIVALMVIYGY